MTTCSLCRGRGTVTVEEPYVVMGYRIKRGTFACDGCQGTGKAAEPHELLWSALNACGGPQRAMVAEALQKACDDLIAAGRRSGSVWTILGLLSGQFPVTEDHKRKAGTRTKERRAA